MTAFLIVLFGGAAILAAASIVATVRRYAAPFRVIALQLADAANPGNAAQRKHLVYARRVKAQPTSRAQARARRAGYPLQGEAMIAAKQSSVLGKIYHRRLHGFNLALLSAKLACE